MTTANRISRIVDLENVRDVRDARDREDAEMRRMFEPNMDLSALSFVGMMASMARSEIRPS